MNILFDLVHPSDVNLFKHAICQLKRDNHNVVITMRNRGALRRIAESEFPDFRILMVGSHRKRLPGKVLSLILREIRFYFLLRKNKIDVAVCQGVSFGVACKILKIPIIHHDDDHEYLLTFLLGKYFSAKDIMPDFMPVSGPNFVKYRGFKELAYLHPQYFQPDPACLDRHGLAPFRYVFIREIANVSVNYKGRSSFLGEIVAYLSQKGIQSVLSLEDKSIVKEGGSNVKVLEEPIPEIFSIMYFASFIVSSGDTMARESCLLGVPCIYTGGRSMSVNDVLIKLGRMFKLDRLEEIKEQIDRLVLIENGHELRDNMKNYVRIHYDDLNKLFVEQIRKVGKTQ